MDEYVKWKLDILAAHSEQWQASELHQKRGRPTLRGIYYQASR
jgi:hypothetical protein